MAGDSGGSSLHYGDPWADPEHVRDPVRRLRGRMPAPVTVWTAGTPAFGAAPAPGDWAGLTVSSVLLAQGEPPRLAGLVGPDTDLADEIQATGTFVVHLLGDRHRRLAQHFAGILPAPDDQLVVEASLYGPVLSAVEDRVLCRVESRRPFGWSVLVEAIVEDTALAPAGPGLAWYRGQLHRLLRDR